MIDAIVAIIILLSVFAFGVFTGLVLNLASENFKGRLR